MTTTFANPFTAEGDWKRGNLHAHTTNSDGKYLPKDAVQYYREAGYDFLAITDHNRFLPESEFAVDDPAFALIRGQEIDVNYRGKNFHIAALNLASPVDFSTERCGDCHPRDVIASIKEHGGVAVLAHPYCSELTADDILLCEGVAAIEAYNHRSQVTRDVGFAFAHWDAILTRGVRMNAVAVDDAHHYSARVNLPADAAGGWIMLKTPSLAPNDIIAALVRGEYYSTMGPKIKHVEIEGNTVYARTSNVRAITFRGSRWTGRKVNRMHGASELIEAEYRIPAGTPFVRIHCADDEGKTAFTNPIYIEGEGAKAV